MTKILIFGDSIAWGAFDDEKGGWAERLKTKYLSTFDNDNGVGVYNLSVSSNNTRGVLHSIENEIGKFNKIEPDDYILLFSIGCNDSACSSSIDDFGVPPDEFIHNLERIIAISKKYSQNIIFTGLTMVDEGLTMPWGEDSFWENARIKRYNDEIDNICRDNDLEFIPLWNIITEADLSDGMHPDSAGHGKIFAQIDKYLSERLLRTSKCHK